MKSRILSVWFCAVELQRDCFAYAQRAGVEDETAPAERLEVVQQSASSTNLEAIIPVPSQRKSASISRDIVLAQTGTGSTRPYRDEIVSLALRLRNHPNGVNAPVLHAERH
jgi:hypothetical protein